MVSQVLNFNRIVYSGLKWRQCVSNKFVRKNSCFVLTTYHKTHIFFRFFGKMCNSFESASTALRELFDWASSPLRDCFWTATYLLLYRFDTASCRLRRLANRTRTPLSKWLNQVRTKYESGTNQIPLRKAKKLENLGKIFVLVKLIFAC